MPEDICSIAATNLDLFGTGNGDDIVTLSKKPRQSDLTSGCIVLLAYSLQIIRQLQDVREVLLRVSNEIRFL
jgi:hypothetical protein